MYTYVQQPGCKKENTATYVYVGPRLVYMAGSERRNIVVVVFMGRQRNASCSWGGNGMRRVHGEGFGVPQNGGNGPPTVEPGVLLIGRAVAYRKTDETDLLQSKRGSC